MIFIILPLRINEKSSTRELFVCVKRRTPLSSEELGMFSSKIPLARYSLH
nr:MAG TPA: hypothetical protein [Caudoviricetes sp.]